MVTRHFLATLVFLALAAPVSAEPTAVVVRAISKDAKFIGDAMGGVAVTLTDARSGRTLAEGVTSGGTGDTKRLIVEPRVRGEALSTPGAAGFATILDIDSPTLVRAEARGPVGKPDAQITVSSMMWLLPGHPVEGDGWILEMPGLVVEPTWTGSGGGSVSAKVTMMCGCPIEPGGHWDAARYDVRAALSKDGRPAGDIKLGYAGVTSMFGGGFADLAPGRYRLLVTAHDARTGNTGVVEREVVVD